MKTEENKSQLNPVSSPSTKELFLCVRDLLKTCASYMEELAEPEMNNGQNNGPNQVKTQSISKENTKPEPSETKLITVAQKRAIISMGKRHGLDENAIAQLCQERFSTNLGKITRRNASSLIENFKAA